jgi:outer membrane protein TolC
MNKRITNCRVALPILALFFGLPLVGWAQTRTQLDLSEAYQLLEQRYPALQDDELLAQTYELDAHLLAIEKLPGIALKADGRLQSESTRLNTGGAEVPFAIDQPLVSIKTYLEANYTLLDGGMNKANARVQQAQLAVDQQNIRVQRYALRDRINQFFLAINLLREQAKLFEFTRADLQSREAAVRAGVENGVALVSDLAQLQVRLLELNGQEDEVTYQEQELRANLSYLVGEDLPAAVQLVLPELGAPANVLPINRPEQELYRLQQQAVLAQTDRLAAQRKPRLAAYAQAGVGYPNPLNILDNGTSPYGVLGVGFNWPIVDWQKEKLQRERLSVQVQRIDNQQATLAFNIEAGKAAYLLAITRLNRQLDNDQAIAELQTTILTQLAVQLDEGVITSGDYVTQLNATLRARQQLVLHQLERQQTQLNYWYRRGGF